MKNIVACGKWVASVVGDDSLAPWRIRIGLRLPRTGTSLQHHTHYVSLDMIDWTDRFLATIPRLVWLRISTRDRPKSHRKVNFEAVLSTENTEIRVLTFGDKSQTNLEI